ncbi:hypothetical protein D3C87_1697290 [compost metagenome]
MSGYCVVIHLTTDGPALCQRPVTLNQQRGGTQLCPRSRQGRIAAIVFRLKQPRVDLVKRLLRLDLFPFGKQAFLHYAPDLWPHFRVAKGGNPSRQFTGQGYRFAFQRYHPDPWR